MNPFWAVSLFWAATVVCIIIALALVLPALMRTRAGSTPAARRDVNIAVYRDQLKEIETDRANGTLSSEQFESAKLELEARLADDALAPDDTPEPSRVGSRKLGYTLGAVMPVAALGLYFLLGNPGALIAVAEAQPGAAQPAVAGVPGDHDIMKMIQQVEDKTKANPDDGEAWAMLGKTYAAVEHWPEALVAYEKAIKLLPQNASVLSGYAEVLAITGNRVLTGKPMELVEKALEINPEDIKGLELAAIKAFQDKSYATAGVYFKRLYKLLPPESPYAQDIKAALEETDRLVKQGMTGLDTLSNPPPADDKTAAKASGGTIKGSVDIAPALKSKLGNKDVLFLFARPAQGGAPVAAIRTNTGTLPMEFELNDGMAMNPGNVLSQHKQVELVARVSKTGNPMAQPGDFEGTVSNVKIGASGVKIVINQTRP